MPNDCQGQVYRSIIELSDTFSILQESNTIILVIPVAPTVRRYFSGCQDSGGTDKRFRLATRISKCRFFSREGSMDSWLDSTSLSVDTNNPFPLIINTPNPRIRNTAPMCRLSYLGICYWWLGLAGECLLLGEGLL